MQKDNNKYFLAFAELISIPPLFKKSLFEFFNYDIKKAWECDREDLKKFSIDYPDIRIPRYFLDKKKEINPDYIFEKTEKNNIKYITYDDEKYPKLLKEICDYPLMLFFKGDLNLCYFDKTIAVVGSRKASQNAKNAISHIISQMKDLPLTIVSGLAYGIDAQAHLSALNNNIPTIGVIASGINIEYPTANKTLYRRIESGGGVIFSEYPVNTPPLQQNFPQRNRIITGLSYGTIVGEAGMRSGALISANLTLEQNRELMCIPGLISNPNTEGIYKLIKQGAPIITDSQDVFEILNWDFQRKEEEIELNHDEKNIFDIISLEPINFEKIQGQANNINTTNLMMILTTLELKGLIKQKNGKYFKI